MSASQTYLVWQAGQALCYKEKGTIKRALWTLKRQKEVISLMNKFLLEDFEKGGPDE